MKKDREKGPTCEARVFPPDRWSSSYVHGVGARYFEDGKHYCKTHAPSEVKRRNDLKEAAWRADRAERREEAEQRKMARAREIVRFVLLLRTDIELSTVEEIAAGLVKNGLVE